jgi:Fe-S-cluster containining protein
MNNAKTHLKGLKRRKISASKIDTYAKAQSKEAFKTIDCLACGNCCKSMTPTFSTNDTKRTSKHFGLSPAQFTEKYLMVEEATGDIINKTMPCSFLDLDTNKCTIYEIRPTDCAGFPHTHRSDFFHHSLAHKQNIMYCPITATVVNSMMQAVLISKTLKP